MRNVWDSGSQPLFVLRSYLLYVYFCLFIQGGARSTYNGRPALRCDIWAIWLEQLSLLLLLRQKRKRKQEEMLNEHVLFVVTKLPRRFVRQHHTSAQNRCSRIPPFRSQTSISGHRLCKLGVLLFVQRDRNPRTPADTSANGRDWNNLRHTATNIAWIFPPIFYFLYDYQSITKQKKCLKNKYKIYSSHMSSPYIICIYIYHIDRFHFF